jgi:predicted nucleic-acid-binding protein
VIAVDTNVLVRLIVDDDADQVRRARALITGQDRIFVSRTVVLEVGWILASRRYQLARETIVAALRALLEVSNFEVEDLDAVVLAIKWYEKGMDFGDAMHLASTERLGAFATFDRGLHRTAAPARCRARALPLRPTRPSESCRCASSACRPSSV